MSASDLRQQRARAFAGVDLYPVTGAEHSDGRTTLDIIDAVKAAGCKIVQLREKTLHKRAYYELAVAVRQRCRDILMICNDHLDVALAVGADGVHLGTEDLPIAVARHLAPDLLIGASSHNREQALAAEAAGADYVNIGPIFATRTKRGAKDFLGPEAVAAIAPQLQVPTTVMGGIKRANIDELLAVGARRIAVVTAVTMAPDVTAAARELRHCILPSAEASSGQAVPIALS